MNVRFGIPPGMPAALQSIAREGSRIPDQSAVAAAGLNAIIHVRSAVNGLSVVNVAAIGPAVSWI